MAFSINRPESTTRNRVPLQLKVTVLKLKLVDGLTARLAMAQAAEQFDHSFPPSYLKVPHSHISRWITEIEKRGEKGDEEVIRLCKEAGLTS